MTPVVNIDATRTCSGMAVEHVLTRAAGHPTPFRQAARSRRATRHACSECRFQFWKRSNQQDRDVLARAQAPVETDEVRNVRQ